MFIWDTATAFVIALTLIYFGSFAWIEVHSRRKRRLSGLASECESPPVEFQSQTSRPRAESVDNERGVGSP